MVWLTHTDMIKTWWRHQMETFSVLLALRAGNSPVTGEFPAQRPVTRSFDVFFDLHLNKLLSKQSWGWWFETPSCSLWCHCNDTTLFYAVCSQLFWYHIYFIFSLVIIIHFKAWIISNCIGSVVNGLRWWCITDQHHNSLWFIKVIWHLLSTKPLCEAILVTQLDRQGQTLVKFQSKYNNCNLRNLIIWKYWQHGGHFVLASTL